MTASVATDSRITFANGLVGQPDWKNFILVTAEDGPVQLLQSVEHAELALMVTDPFQIVPEYDLELSDADCAALDLGPNERPALLCTLSVHHEQITSNLVGPLVINTRTGSARQVVLLDSPYSTRFPVAPIQRDS